MKYLTLRSQSGEGIYEKPEDVKENEVFVTENSITIKPQTDIGKRQQYRLYNSDGEEIAGQDWQSLGSDGTITFTGLDAGTYTLTEVATNDGYNLLDTDVTVTIAADGTVSMSGAKSVSDGKIVIENAKGAVLPSTGGIGTTIFYVLGTILVFGCGIILVAKKRAKAMDK